MKDMFQFADALGPAKIVHIHVPDVRLRAVVVIDNVACGAAIGGVRMAPMSAWRNVCAWPGP
jgi:glutamate dehydrogenase (NAD(P)+)